MGERRVRRGGAFPAAVLAAAVLSAGLLAPSSAGSLEPAGPPVASDEAPAAGRVRTDPTLLLAGASPAPVRVVVKLDYEAVAAYRGGLAGLPATSPSATGAKLDRAAPAAASYEAHVAGVEERFVAALAAAVPDARVGRRLRTVYGGVALTVPGDRVGDLVALPGVVAVQRDEVRQALTDSSAAFVGAPTLYGQLGATERTAGAGTVVGVLDSGVWPEHPSFADAGLPPPPARPDGRPRGCAFGDNPLTAAHDPFRCNRKLVAGRAFLETYDLVFGDDPYPGSARDGVGHGTHVASTAAGAYVARAPVRGVERGPVHGVAPGAAVAAYKVCGPQGCADSDVVAGVGAAVDDGVDVLNFSIGGGAFPYLDPVALAFLDAYAAGVVVTTPAGNAGPGPSTAHHLAPWVITVAASTQRRAYESSLDVVAPGGTPRLELRGASLTGGLATPAPLRPAGAAPGYADPLCSTPAPPGAFAGRVAVCERGGVPRVDKGRNVLRGGAVGMVLHEPTGAGQGTEADSHWLPTVHVDGPSGAALLAFARAHPGATARFSAGKKVVGRGDVVAATSSRGPGGDVLKPDLAAPGVAILAGFTPTPAATDAGPPGQYFQARTGTSHSAPHAAGAAALLLALHPGWTPGAVKSALMTTAALTVVKEDGTTPADPFDVGAGRIDLARAGDPGLVLDETAERFSRAEMTLPPVALNLPSLAPVLPASGALVVSRAVTNVSGRELAYATSARASRGTLTVRPSRFRIAPGATQRISVAISAPSAPLGRHAFGSVVLDEVGGPRDLHLPVAFARVRAP